MKRNNIFCPLLKVLILSFLLSGLSCGRQVTIPEHLNHDFLHGVAKDLYRTQDLKMTLNEQTVTPLPKSLEKYEKLLKYKKPLYKKSVNFNLNELLKITTKGKGKPVKISSNNNISIGADIPFLNEYQILDYTIQPPKTKKQTLLKDLLGNITDFKGFPNTNYYIFSKFLGNYLILYKLGSPDKIPYEEIPLAKRVGHLLAVPLVGYPVEYCKAVRVLGSNNIKKTLKYRPVCNSLQTDKEYIRLRTHNKQIFQYQKKRILFHKDFFKGKWLYYKTPVKQNSANYNVFINDPPVNKAQLVKFHRSIGKLDVIEVNNLKQDDEQRVIFIPVEWKDYEIAKDSELLDSSFSERLKDVDESQRPYLQIDFSSSVGGESIKSAVIAKDYISFDVESRIKEGRSDLTKFAFKRYEENKNYKEKKWFYRDNFLFFPLYFVERKYYQNLTDHTRNDLDYFKRSVRFDPHPDPKKNSNIKEITWYFSTQTPKDIWIRKMGHLAVDLLNQAFEKAGKDPSHKIKIVLDSSKDKELGDIRYNILNLILSEGESPGEFQKGFNLANPFTGEVVAGTANIWLTPIINEYIKLIRQYIRFQIDSPVWKMQPFSEKSVELINKNIDNKNLQCAFSKKYSDEVTPISGIPIITDKNSNKVLQKPLGVTPFFHEKIQTICKEDVVQFIKDNQKKTFGLNSSPLEDYEIVRSCAQKMAKEKILQHILKNMLHSLGLKNMYSSSFDSENFYKPEEIKALLGNSTSLALPHHHFSVLQKTASHPDPPQYSSVMEPMDKQYPILSVPGKLDIAALRFLYFDKIDLKSGQPLEVPSIAFGDLNSQKSILQTARKKGYNEDDIKKYTMCNVNKWTHVSCEKESYGATVIEVATNEICKIHNTFLMNKQRYDAEQIEIDIKKTSVLSNIYSNWKEFRDNLLKRKSKSIEDYSFLNPNHVKEYQEIISEITVTQLKSYELVRQLIFDYFKRLIFAPLKHCIYKTGKNYTAIGLEHIEAKILSAYPDNNDNKNKEFINCQSPIVTKWVEENLAENSKFVTEVGFFGKERRYALRPNIQTDPVDKFQAFEFFYRNFFKVKEFKNIFQEPDLAKEYYNEWLNYVTQGLDFNPYIDENIIPIPFRILSYQMDTMEDMGYKDITTTGGYITNQTVYFKNLWDFRLLGFKWIRTELKIENKNLNLFRQHFYYQSYSESELKYLVNSFEKDPGLYAEFPILNNIYEEYLECINKQNMACDHRDKTYTEDRLSFQEFIQNHPAVLYDQDKQNYRLPFEDSENYILSQLYRKYNEFSQCIKEKGNACDQEEEKRAFIRLMLDTEDDFFKESL